jgi:hypothetical protein
MRWVLTLLLIAATGCAGLTNPGADPAPVDSGSIPWQQGSTPDASPAEWPQVPSLQDSLLNPPQHAALQKGPETQVLQGGEYWMKDSSATTHGANLVLTAGSQSASWALYGFYGYTDQDEPLSVTLQFAEEPAQYYIGFADFGRGAWVWRDQSAKESSESVSDVFSFPGLRQAITASGNIMVIVMTWNGENATLESVTVEVDVDLTGPVADLARSPDCGNAELTVDFDASESVDLDGGGIVQYEWDWEGDGVYGPAEPAPTANHTYTEAGLYTPVVRVTDNDDKTDTDTITVRVQGWAHTWGGTRNEYLSAVCADAGGNVYAAGQTNVLDVYDEVLLIKYSPYGKPLWQRTWGGSDIDRAHGIAVDSEGNV